MKQYTYKRLQELTKELKKKIEAKTADQKETFLAVSAAHALDFLDLARDNKLKLDLTFKTEENVAAVLVKLHFVNTKRGMTAEDSRLTILKKLGGYELFTVFNGISEASSKIGFDVNNNGIVLSHENADGNTVQFDVYDELEKVLKTFQLSAPNEEFAFFGTLAPFYETVSGQFLQKLN